MGSKKATIIDPDVIVTTPSAEDADMFALDLESLDSLGEDTVYASEKPKKAEKVEEDLLLDDLDAEDTPTKSTEDTKDSFFDDADDLDDEDESTTDLTEIAKVTDHVKSLSTEDIDNMADRITGVDEQKDNLVWVIYGKNGTGKTTLLSTLEGMLIVAIEDGTMSIRRRTDVTRTRKILIKDWEDIEALYWYLKKLKPHKDGGLIIPASKKYPEFVVKGIAFDTVTGLINVCFRNILGVKDILTITQRNWGDMTQKVTTWLGYFEDLPVDSYWLLQERNNGDNLDDDEFAVCPDANNKLRTFLTSEADVIARTRIKKREGKNYFYLIASPNERAVTKDRTGVLIKPVRNPNLDAINAKIFE